MRPGQWPCLGELKSWTALGERLTQGFPALTAHQLQLWKR